MRRKKYAIWKVRKVNGKWKCLRDEGRNKNIRKN